MTKHLAALAFLMASSQMARAETTILTCQGAGRPPYVLKIDTDNKTVTDEANPVPTATLPAQISDEEITWWGGNEFPRYSLSRITGNRLSAAGHHASTIAA